MSRPIVSRPPSHSPSTNFTASARYAIRSTNDMISLAKDRFPVLPPAATVLPPAATVPPLEHIEARFTKFLAQKAA